MSKQTDSLHNLFVSKVRIKVLKYFVFQPDVPIHLRGAVRETHEEINAVRRELQRLEEIYFIRSEVRGNRKYFTLNLDFPFLSELSAIFHKSFGIGGTIIDNVNKLGDVQFAILAGSFTNLTKMSTHNVDLVLVGQINEDVLTKIVQEAETKLGREINYTVMKGSEFILRKKRRDSFIMELLIGNKILLVGRNEDLIS